MKKMIVLIAAVLALAAPMVSFGMDHGSMDMGHGAHQGDVAHEEVVDGVKATFKVMSMKEHMKAMDENMKLMRDMTPARSACSCGKSRWQWESTSIP